MKITKIESQKNPNRVNIYIDDKFAFGLNDEIRYKYNLKSGVTLTKEFIEDILKEEEKNKAFNQALNYISYRQRSEKEVYDNLKNKDYPEHVILEVIDKCKKLNYIDDVNFAQSYTNDKININNYGSYRIKHELNRKGIDQNIIDQVVNLNHDDEYKRALNLANKRLHSYRNDDRNAQYRKLSGYLQRRGYSYSIISDVLREVLD